MIDLKDIQENYKRMPLEKLIMLANNPKELELEAIGILQQELLNRNQTKEALSFTEFLINRKKENSIGNMSMPELKQLIKDRLESGEPIENIKIDLKEEGIDIFDIVNSDNKLKEKAFDYILHLKENGNNDNEIDKKLKEILPR